MKNSIIILGIALVTVTNITSAIAQQSFIKEDSLAQMASSRTNYDRNTTGHSTENKKQGEDPEPFDPKTIVIETYSLTMEEIIIENNKIIDSAILTEQPIEKNSTENNEVEISIQASPVDQQKEMEYKISQALQIIDAPVLTTIDPAILKKSKK